ncbi:aldehyde dehydrogenase [Rhizodiscina lignyota]|uniref:Aldehyde dehydrogenase n=1 Tax=Rhizodiscina lignyota TaxID=1504668 RepID=A0A9P4ISE6_9PEZI|nr:aldehyde dehydrogenase [Rhizodiscina lignyota]
MAVKNVLQYTPVEEIPAMVKSLDDVFRSDKTESVEWRKGQIKQLWRMMDEKEAEFQEALRLDEGKPQFEAQVFEMGLVKNDCLHMLAELDGYLEPEAVAVPPPFEYWQPKILRQPKGVALIIAPWNFPINLTMLPLLGNIAAGNTVVIKPSEYTPHTAQRLAEFLPQYLDPDCFKVVNGDAPIVEALLEQKFDVILFTGSRKNGHSVMAAAAKHLTPVILELGGKSPVIISDKANLPIIAKRLAWGKFWNLGQICMVPDYALVQESVYDEFVELLKKEIESQYGPNPRKVTARIINENHFQRLSKLLSGTKGKFAVGGKDLSIDELFIEPTVIRDVSEDDVVMQDEIFGPILPVLKYQKLEDVRAMVRKIDENPLGGYICSEDQAEIDYVVKYIRAGDVSVNDMMAHIAVTGAPFGGQGGSGMGRYRGKGSILAFTHPKSNATVSTSDQFEGMLSWRYKNGERVGDYDFYKQHLEPALN